jgi:hypothetical protein
MSRRKATDDVLGFILMVAIAVVLAIGTALVAAFEYLVRTGWIWLFVALIVGGVGFLIWYQIKNAQNRKQRESERVEAILTHREEWGVDVCQYLIESKRELDERVTGIMAHGDEWGHDTCFNLLQQTIGIGMTSEMVRLSLGEPDTVDNRDATKTGEKYRWIYGVPRQGAAYIWFKNDKVTRIKQ